MQTVKTHQLLFIFFSIILIGVNNYIPNIFNDDNSLIIALILIGTIGLSHGAIDGKIIYYANCSRLKIFFLFLVYLLIVFLGLLLWFNFPIIGLSLLLIMSVIHFGNSDLYYLKKNHLIKFIWGLMMTLFPIMFYPEIVNEIFNILTKTNIPLNIFILAQDLLIILSIFLSLLLVLPIQSNNWALFEFIILMILAKIFHPLIWFGLYFCGVHGIRALIAEKFRINPDLSWLLIFSIPVIMALYFLMDQNVYEYSVNLYSVFPVVAALTISHMLLPKIIAFIENYR
jgi:Brp/Blh family beta-carotene 15,15'-monooxygenase